MNIKLLEYFCMAAECKNITVAAERLKMAQPPLSRALKTLEKELDTVLIIRSNKGICLTEAGNLLYTRSMLLFKEIEQIRNNIRDTSKDLCGNIKIGACYSTLSLIAQKMQIFLALHPACTFSILYGTIDELEAKLRTGAIDLLFLRNCIIDGDIFAHVSLHDDPLCLLVHKDLDPMPDVKSPDVTYLKNLPLCLLDKNRSAGQYDYIFNICKTYNFIPNIVCTYYDSSAGLALALNKVAATFIPLSMASMADCQSLNIKQINGLTLSSCPTLIYNPNIYHTRSTQAFLSLFSNRHE